MLVAALDAGDIDLLPFDGYVVGLEDFTDNFRDFRANTITLKQLDSWVARGVREVRRAWDQGNSVFAAEFARSEDVGLDSRHTLTTASALATLSRPRGSHLAAIGAATEPLALRKLYKCQQRASIVDFSYTHERASVLCAVLEIMTAAELGLRTNSFAMVVRKRKD